jgi:predicted ATPase
MVAQLDQPLAFLTAGPRDLPARQRTLRATIAWTYSLLDGSARTLFRRLAVCTGGCTLSATQALGGGQDAAAGDGPRRAFLDVLGVLVENNLLALETRPGIEPRFTMLETLRHFGLEQLEASGEVETIRCRHAGHFLERAEHTAGALHGPELPRCLERLDAERANLRAALDWFVRR